MQGLNYLLTSVKARRPVSVLDDSSVLKDGRSLINDVI
jgi:hypothetical protein